MSLPLCLWEQVMMMVLSDSPGRQVLSHLHHFKVGGAKVGSDAFKQT